MVARFVESPLKMGREPGWQRGQRGHVVHGPRVAPGKPVCLEGQQPPGERW